MKKSLISLFLSSGLLSACGTQEIVLITPEPVQNFAQNYPQSQPFSPTKNELSQNKRTANLPISKNLNPELKNKQNSSVNQPKIITQSNPSINKSNKIIIGDNYSTQTLLAGLNSAEDLIKVKEISAKYNLKVDKVLNGINTVVFSTNGQNVTKLLGELSKEPIFAFVETDNVSTHRPEKETSITESLFKILNNEPVNDSYFKDQYGLKNISAANAWNQAKGDNVIVSVIDSGVDVDHADLKNRVVAGYDAFSRDSSKDAGDASGLNYVFGSYKHGSHVAGIISAEANNGKGIAGVAPNAKIMPVKIFPDLSDFFKTAKKNDDGSEVTVVSAIADGIVWSVDHQADIINMSLAVWSPSNTIERAVNYALEKNVSVIVAAGNERHVDNRINHLAAIKGVIGVGATDQQNNLTYFSNSGSYVSVVAPGHEIISTVPSFLNVKLYTKMSGTSMASPHVAGLAALLKSKFGSLATPQWIKARIENTATDLGVTGRDDLYGHGLINAEKALNDPL